MRICQRRCELFPPICYVSDHPPPLPPLSFSPSPVAFFLCSKKPLSLRIKPNSTHLVSRIDLSRPIASKSFLVVWVGLFVLFHREKGLLLSPQIELWWVGFFLRLQICVSFVWLRMSPALLGLPTAEALPPKSRSSVEQRFAHLRGVQWRIYLGILPSAPSSSIDDYRRAAADSRRSYARLRRRLLIDPHLPKNGNAPVDPALDNPLSQNPDSMWGRFFRNAELERTLDQDLSRLYPEHGSYFQSSTCQAMLRRVLLFWCLTHPEYGYRQGMHELLAPLLYVLHVDVQLHFEVRKKHEGHFTDECEETSFSESDVISNHRFSKTDWDDADESTQGMTTHAKSLDELDPETRDIISLSDAYGAEGELGMMLSDRFMEHDAYCMFDALMNGSRGVVALAEFFAPSPTGSNAFLPPVIEASSALYHLLSVVDSVLHSHLVELGVEPHYFAMRWLRVLFGREFSLRDLLVIWDQIFSCPNGMSCHQDDAHQLFKVLSSPRGAFISAMAVSMILHLRSSLLATEHATSCLQKLLNFPENIDVKKLIEKATSLEALALEISSPKSPSQANNGVEAPRLSQRHSIGASSPKTALYPQPESSYWEEKWRVLHDEEASMKKKGEPSLNGIIKDHRGEKVNLFRRGSDPCPSKNSTTKKESLSSIKRSLLADLSRIAIFSKQTDKSKLETCVDASEVVPGMREVLAKDWSEHPEGESSISGTSVEGKADLASSAGENSCCHSASSSPTSVIKDHDNESEEKGHIISNPLAGNYDEGANSLQSNTIFCNDPIASPSSPKPVPADKDVSGSHGVAVKEKKAPSKFPWFWKFSKSAGDANMDRRNQTPQNPEISGDSHGDFQPSISESSKFSDKKDVGDKNMMGTLNNLGSSMLENIQVIESAFQQEFGQPASLENLSSNILGGKGHSTAWAALRELRKISSLLSEM